MVLDERAGGFVSPAGWWGGRLVDRAVGSGCAGVGSAAPVGVELGLEFDLDEGGAATEVLQFERFGGEV
jgi:hypothetical protein